MTPMLWKTQTEPGNALTVLMLHGEGEPPLIPESLPGLRLLPVRCAAEFFLRVPPRHPHSVLAVEINAPDEATWEALGRLVEAERKAGIPVIVISDLLEPGFIRRLLHLQAADWLQKPVNPRAFTAACQRVAVEVEAAKPATGRIIAFTPVLGGLGATTLAIQAGLHFTRKKGEDTACLIDLDFASGECTDYLDLPATLQLEELEGSAERLDPHMLDVMLARHRSGLSVLAARTEIGAHGEPGAEVVARLLDLAAARFETLVLDLPRHWHAWSDGVMLGATDVFFVSDPSVPALRAARRALEQVDKHFQGAVNPRVIVNKYERSFFSLGVAEKEIRAMLGGHLAGFVGHAPDAMREAINRGVPVEEISGGKRIARDMARILDKEPAHAGA